MHTYADDKKWTRQQIADYWDCSKQTLAVWDCTGRYKLNPQKNGKEVFYFQSDLEKFMGAPMKSNAPLLRRAKAAKYVMRAPTSLATWASNGKHDLKPRKIGGLRRYCTVELDKYLEQQQKPY